MKKTLLIAVLVVVLSSAVAPVVSAAEWTADSPLPPGDIPPAPPPEDMTLENILLWVVSGGCGFLAFFVIEKLAGDWFHNRPPETKQYIASAISGALAVLAFVGLVGLGIEDSPGELLAWVDVLLPVFFVGAGFANLTHARLVLRGKEHD